MIDIYDGQTFYLKTRMDMWTRMDVVPVEYRTFPDVPLDNIEVIFLYEMLFKLVSHLEIIRKNNFEHLFGTHGRIIPLVRKKKYNRISCHNILLFVSAAIFY